ncbi:isoprenylcysteine carboxylmethyltransferase family protein [Virgisporangium ochraceum]|uniref:Isoprenylcysteine carboxyl methyltransferase n=1 Tax=Virgisporangium ochraceum TaxID=65505 RepID=A0A8J4EGW4_9ACTN|nr:isoprenylcysteine carboxylmethyltransferase family protein [Virgisporangium ochraceum]GIJ74126.1 hypothetical protein Voc01_090430 [Virgisporangium ochraceum]
MAVAALVIYLLGLVLAFGWRSVVQRRRTGDSGLRLAAGASGTVAWWAKVAFIAALLLGFAGPVAGIAGVAPVRILDHGWLQVGGVVLAVGGVLATLAAQVAMGASWRVGVDPAERTALVTTGAFALVRNPIFSAMGVTSLGLMLMVPNVIAIAATAVLVLSVQVQVRAVEEPYLVGVHGTAYVAYASRVGRFVPRLGVMRAPHAHGRQS